MKNAYGIFLMVEMARIHGAIPKKLEYDLTWETAEKMHNLFEQSKFNDGHKSECDCIVDFVKDIMDFEITKDSLNKFRDGTFDNTAGLVMNDFEIRRFVKDALEGKIADIDDSMGDYDSLFGALVKTQDLELLIMRTKIHHEEKR